MKGESFAPDEVHLTVRTVGGRLHVAWQGDAFLAVKASFKETFSRHGEAVYLGAQRVWSMPLSTRRRLCQWLDDNFQSACITWHEPESFSDTTGDTGQGRYQGAHQTAPMSLKDARDLLCVTSAAPAGLVEVAYRWWCKQEHPDLHPARDGRAMAALNQAIFLIRHERGVDDN